MGQFICNECKRTFSLEAPIWRCDCGGLLSIEFEARFDRKKISERKPSIWRYREAIPLRDDASIVSFDEGFTPLLPVGFKGRTVHIKLDYIFSTGSYKDRGASILISKVKELGVSEIVEDSSGNAGAAIAAYSAKAGIRAIIFVPDSAPPEKTAQIEAYGARLERVPGSREDTARAIQKAAETTYYASHYWNPFFFQGTKTFAFEVAEQLGWKAPDAVILPVGNGTLVIGAYLGFKDLFTAGVIDKMPRIIAVQAENCSPLEQAFRGNSREVLRVATEQTIADGIAIAEPLRGGEIVGAVRKTGGSFIAVGEDEIKEALLSMGRQGYYIEPTSAATIAGINKYLETTDREELLVSTFTGSGLKETGKILTLLG